MSPLAAQRGPTRWWRFAPIDERRRGVEVRGVLDHLGSDCSPRATWRHCARRAGPLLLVVGWSGMACREAGPAGACQPSAGVEVWVERRFPSTVELADTAFASLSLSIARDSTARLPAGATISAVIAGPSTAPLPDTVRVLSAELPSRAALWRGDQLRPGEYTAHLRTAGYTAGPRAFSLAPGERVEIEARLRHTVCTGDSVRGSTGESTR